EAPVTVEIVIRTLEANMQVIQDAIYELIGRLPDERDCFCKDALEDAFVTQRDSISSETLKKLKPLVQRYFD
ncbi:MAG: S-methyl-5'-thioadenosine phosphorylase, partial [Anaerolineales bacterium]